MMLSGGMGGQMGGQMNPLMLSLLLGDDVPKSKSAYDKICAADPACAAEVAKIYNADGVSILSQPNRFGPWTNFWDELLGPWIPG